MGDQPTRALAAWSVQQPGREQLERELNLRDLYQLIGRSRVDAEGTTGLKRHFTTTWRPVVDHFAPLSRSAPEEPAGQSRLSASLLDPIGGVHAAEHGSGKKSSL